MPSLTTLILLTTSLTLTASTPASNFSSSSSSSAAASTSSPPSASSLASLNLPGGTASPALTLFMYGDPDCTTFNATDNDLTNALPLSYNRPSPQYPFLGFQMTRNLTSGEVLTFYTTTNTSGEACGEVVGDLTEKDGGAGWCLPLVGGATCYNLTRG